MSDRIIPVPLRADGTTAHLDLPPDITPAEARKIANVILAFASTESSDEYQKLVEAVARAIHDTLENDDDSGGGGYIRAARAALSALSVSETAGRVQLKLPHADDAADPSRSEVAGQPQPPAGVSDNG